METLTNQQKQQLEYMELQQQQLYKLEDELQEALRQEELLDSTSAERDQKILPILKKAFDGGLVIAYVYRDGVRRRCLESYFFDNGMMSCFRECGIRTPAYKEKACIPDKKCIEHRPPDPTITAEQVCQKVLEDERTIKRLNDDNSHLRCKIKEKDAAIAQKNETIARLQEELALQQQRSRHHLANIESGTRRDRDQ